MSFHFERCMKSEVRPKMGGGCPCDPPKFKTDEKTGSCPTVDNFVTAKTSNFNKQAANASKHNKFKSFQSESTSWRRQGQQQPEIS